MRLFKKANAARDLIRNTATGKLELQLDRVIMRAIQHGDVVQIDIFIAQLQNPLRDELRLFAPIVQRHDRRLHRV